MEAAASSKKNNLRLSKILEELWPRIDSFAKDDLEESTSWLVRILMRVGRLLGIPGILRHYKWREVAMAGILKHRVYGATSTGAGGDAADLEGGVCEYKTGKVEEEELLRQIRKDRLKITMIYNDAYGRSRILPHRGKSHFFGLFDEATEECLLIYRADTQEVVKQLLANDPGKKPGKTTNLNAARFDVSFNDGDILYLSDTLRRLIRAARQRHNDA